MCWFTRTEVFLYTAEQDPVHCHDLVLIADGTLATPATTIPNTGPGSNGIGTTKF